MATKEYAIKAPDGSVIRFRAPSDAPKEKILAFAKQQFEARPSTQEVQSQPASGTPNRSSRQARAERSSSARKAEIEEYLSNLEKINPYQAQELRDMSPSKRALIGVGAGFADILTGVGLRDRDAFEERALEQISKSGSSFGIGRAIGQAAPFAGAGVVAGSALKGAPLAVNALTQGAIGATEGGLIARGTGGDALDVATGALIGGAIAGGAEALSPAINRAARSLVNKVKGKPSSGRLIDDAGRPTKELQSALDESGQSFDDVVREANRESKGKAVESIVEAGRSNDARKAADSVTISQERLAAAESIGLAEDAPVSVLTDDQAMQELSGALAAVQGTRASDALDTFTEEFGRRADEYIESIGGSTDRGLVTQSLLDNMQSDISRIKALENRLYQPIDDAIGAGTQVRDYADSIKNRLQAKARNSGGVSRLPRHEKEMLEMIKSKEGITYQNLTDKMRQIGDAAYRKNSAFDDIDTASLKRMYSDLAKVRDGAADAFGVGAKMRRAKSLGQSRFSLQESSEALFGKDFNKSIFPSIDRAVKGLSKGSVREFAATMDSIPAKHRKSVAATMLNTAMTGGRDQSRGVNSGEFSKWYRNVSRNKSAMNSLRKYVGGDAVDRLDNFAKVADGVAGVTKGRVRTGITPEALKRLDDVDGVTGKLYRAAQKIQGVPVVGRGAAAVSNTAKMFTLDKTPAVEAADQLMGSTQFRSAVIEAAKSGVNTRNFRKLNNKLKSTPAYRKYINQLDKGAQSQIAASGLIPWLASEDEEE